MAGEVSSRRLASRRSPRREGAVRRGGPGSPAARARGPRGVVAGSSGALRTFVAVRLTAGMCARLEAAVARLRAGARGVAWVAAENLHLTLKFLVESRRRARRYRGRAHRGGGRSLGLCARGARARSVSDAISPARDLGRGDGGRRPADRPCPPRWREPGSARLRPGSALLRRPRDPGRVREPRRDPALARAHRAGGDADFGRCGSSVALMRSELSPRGARYTDLVLVLLAVPSGTPDKRRGGGSAGTPALANGRAPSTLYRARAHQEPEGVVNSEH